MNKQQKILVTGATGNVGSGLVPALQATGVAVRALVRDEDKATATALHEQGVEVVVGDLEDAAAVETAVAGVDKIYLLTWNGPTACYHVKNVVDAAKKTGTPHIVRHSMWGSANSRIVQEGNSAEQIVKNSGLPWTILKPTFFMQNLMMAAPTIASDGNIYWDVGEGRISMIDVRDIVDTAVAVLTSRGHAGKSYILTGPEAISLHDAAATLSQVLAQDVRYVSVPTEAAYQSLTGMGFPSWIAQGFGELMAGFSQGFASQPTDNVAQLTGHPARSFKTFVCDFAHAFAPAPTAA